MLSFLIFSASTQQNNIKDIQRLEAEDTPSFRFLPSEEGIADIEGRFNVDTVLNNERPDGKNRTQREFFACSVTITNSRYYNNYAFGSGLAVGTGGAIFISVSQAVLGKSDFDGNKATTGGAIGSIASNLFIDTDSSNSFINNIAYTYGGAIYYQAIPKDKSSDVFLKFQAFRYKFENNVARQTGGAIAIISDTDAYLEKLFFKQNEAYDQGGALYIVNTDAKLYMNKIYQNVAGNRPTRTLTNTKFDSIDQKIAPRFRGRGCGGISFISTLREHNLITQENCFAMNQMYSGVQKVLEYDNDNGNVIGNDIMIEASQKGYVYWQSMTDYYKNDKIFAVFLGDPKNFRKGIYDTKQYNNNNNPDCFTNMGGDSAYATGTYSFSWMSTGNKQASSTSSVPAPTEYTYVATPITRLPYATTKSYVTYPTSKNIWTITHTYSVARTPRDTPRDTPSSTPRTTPSSTPSTTPSTTPSSTPRTTPNPTPTPEPTAETPKPTLNPLLSETRTYTYQAGGASSTLSFSPTATSFGITVTTYFTFTDAFIPSQSEGKIIFTSGKSVTVVATDFKSSTVNMNILLPIYTDVANTINVNPINSNIQIYTFTDTNAASSVLSATLTQTLATFITGTSSIGKDKVYVYTKISTDIYTYSTNGATLTLIRTNSMYTLTETINVGVGSYMTYSTGAGQSTSILTSLTTNVNFYTFTLSSISLSVPTSYQEHQPSTLTTMTETSTTSYTNTEVDVDTISYYSGFQSATADTYTVVYKPFISNTFTMASNTYTYTAVTTFGQTYSSVSNGQSFVSYIAISTKYKKSTLTATDIKTNTIYATNVLTLLTTDSSYYTVTTGTTYKYTNTSLSVNNLATTAVMKNAASFTMTSTFCFTTISGTTTTVTYKFTEYINAVKQVTTNIYVKSSLITDYVTSVANTDIISSTVSTITILTYTLSKFGDPPALTPMSDISTVNFNDLLYTQTTGPSLTFAQTTTSTSVITFMYKTTINQAINSKIWTNSMIYKSTFINDVEYKYTYTNTITEVITTLSGEVQISTVIQSKYQGKTEFITQNGRITTIVQNSAISTIMQQKNTITITTTTAKSISSTSYVISKTATDIPIGIITDINTLTIAKFPISTVSGGTITQTDIITATSTKTTGVSTTISKFYAIGPTTIYGYTEVTHLNTQSAIQTDTNVIVFSTISTNAPDRPPVKPIIPAATENILLSKTLTITQEYGYTQTSYISYSESKTRLTTSSIYEIYTKDTIYTSTWTTLANGAPSFTFTVADTYYYTFKDYTTNDPTETVSYVSIYTSGSTNTVYEKSTETSITAYAFTYSLTDGAFTITTKNTLTDTIVYIGTQYNGGDYISVLYYTAKETMFITNINGQVTGLWTVTHVPSITKTLTTATLTVYPSTSSISTNMQVTSKAGGQVYTSITFKLPPATPLPSPKATPNPSLAPGMTWVEEPSYLPIHTETNISIITSSKTIILPGTEYYIPTETMANTSTFTLVSEDGTLVDKYTLTEAPVITITVTKVSGDPKVPTEIPAATITTTPGETSTLLPTSTITSSKSGDAELTGTKISVSSATEISTQISTLSSTYTEVTSGKTTIFTNTEVPTEIYTTVPIPGKDNEYTTTLTVTLTESITKTETTYTGGYTFVDTISTKTTYTLTATLSETDTATYFIVPVPTRSPLPTATPLPTQSPLPSPKPSPSQSPVPRRTLEPDGNVPVTMTESETETVSYTNTKTLSETESEVVMNDGKKSTVKYLTEVEIRTTTYVITKTSVQTEKLDTTNGEKKNSMLPIIIGAACGGLLLIILIIVLVVLLMKKKGAEDSSDSAVEMNEETVLHIPDSSNTGPMTNDNPLWTTSVLGDTDDPFNKDFEEDAIEGFFNVHNANE